MVIPVTLVTPMTLAAPVALVASMALAEASAAAENLSLFSKNSSILARDGFPYRWLDRWQNVSEAGFPLPRSITYCTMQPTFIINDFMSTNITKNERPGDDATIRSV